MLSKMAYFCAFFCGFSGNDDSDATFPKSLGGTNKRTDFVTAVGKYCDLYLKACHKHLI